MIQYIKRLFCKKQEPDGYLVEMFKNVRGKWMFHVVARNGNIICHSEDYASKQMCKHTAKALVMNKLVGPEEKKC